MYNDTEFTRLNQFNPMIQSLKKAAKHSYAFELIYNISSPSASFTEFSAWDNELDELTTPVQLHYKSSAALDKDAAGGTVRAIKLIGFTVDSVSDYQNGDEDPKWTIETLRMDSSDGTTDQTTTKYYLRVLHCYACEWGTGDTSSHEAEGNITIGDDSTPTTTYLTIAAGDNDSNGSKVIIPDGYRAYIPKCVIQLKAAPTNIYDGTAVQMTITDEGNELNTAPDITDRVWVSTILEGQNIFNGFDTHGIEGSDGCILTFNEKNIGNAVATQVRLVVLLWKDR
jgi:hypothetical protein